MHIPPEELQVAVELGVRGGVGGVGALFGREVVGSGVGGRVGGVGALLGKEVDG